MYVDYFHNNSYIYIVAVILPVIFVRRYKDLFLVFLFSCVVSGLLVHLYMPETQAFFMPFDKYLEILAVLEAVIFGIAQVLLLFLINSLKNTRNKFKYG